MKHKVGDDMYIPSAMYISRGSDDRVGGLAEIKSIDSKGMVSFKEIPGVSYNYEYLLKEQDKLKKEFGNSRAYPDPDIDTPWIESGDIVNGETYKGKPIW